MSEQINPNDPAYPCLRENLNETMPLIAAGFGMSIRTKIAIEAMKVIPHVGCGADLRLDEIAGEAVILADLLIEKLNQTEPKS